MASLRPSCRNRPIEICSWRDTYFDRGRREISLGSRASLGASPPLPQLSTRWVGLWVLHHIIKYALLSHVRMSLLYYTSSSRLSSCQSVEVCTPSLDNPKVEEVRSSSSEEASHVNLRVLQDFKSMRSYHDYDLVVSIHLLNCLRIRYYISIEFNLQVP